VQQNDANFGIGTLAGLYTGRVLKGEKPDTLSQPGAGRSGRRFPLRSSLGRLGFSRSTGEESVLSQKNAGNVLACIAVDHHEIHLASRPLAQFGMGHAIQILIHDDADLVVITNLSTAGSGVVGVGGMWRVSFHRLCARAVHRTTPGTSN
jgi:hypothetical protein